MTSPALPLLNLRRHEIAAVLNVSVWKVDELIRTEALPSFKLGGTRVARFEDVKAFNDSRAGQSLANELKEADVNQARAQSSRAVPSAASTDTSATTSTSGVVIPMRVRGRSRRGAR